MLVEISDDAIYQFSLEVTRVEDCHFGETSYCMHYDRVCNKTSL